MNRFPIIPAGLFGMVLGLTGLGGSWRAAARWWDLPTWPGEAVMTVGVLVWAVLTVLYALKWLVAKEKALAEVRDAIQCCFVGLVPASAALAGLAVAPYHHNLAVVLAVIGGLGQLAFGVFRSGGLWRGGRDLNTVSPIMFLPTVAGNFIAAIAAGTLGQPSWGLLFFGIGFFNWVVLESIILFRLWMAPAMEGAFRLSIGVQLAPPAVGALAYLANTQGTPDLFSQIMWGYGVFQVLSALRLLPWITRIPFSGNYWSFTFGVTALSTAGIIMSERGALGAIPTLAPFAFALANIVVITMALGTVLRLFQGSLLPSAPAPAAKA